MESLSPFVTVFARSSLTEWVMLSRIFMYSPLPVTEKPPLESILRRVGISMMTRRRCGKYLNEYAHGAFSHAERSSGKSIWERCYKNRKNYDFSRVYRRRRGENRQGGKSCRPEYVEVLERCEADPGYRRFQRQPMVRRPGGRFGRSRLSRLQDKVITHPKGLFQAMSSYNMKMINPGETQGARMKEPLTPQGHKGFAVYGAGEPTPFEGKQALLIRWRMQGREFIEVKDVQ